MSTRKYISYSTLALITFACVALLPELHAVSPPPDGGYPNGNTAEGQAALLSLTTGGFNTAVGFLSSRNNATNSFNTALGAATLLANTAEGNTAIGAGALLNNTIGQSNTANGAFALLDNIDGGNNTAIGFQALLSNTGGASNTATGFEAMRNNTSGNHNTASGAGALESNTTGGENTASGVVALTANTEGNNNTANGEFALFFNSTGNNNTAIGQGAGSNQTTGSNNVYIGSAMPGVAGESNACYIASIFGQTSASGAAVFINSDGKLGTVTSSKRFKDDIKTMDNSSEAIFALKPVRFHYRKEIDPDGIPQFGLVAEEVEAVDPDLIVRDKEGKANTVRYEAINAMLLNEFLKEHRTVQEQGATIAVLKQEIAALSATVMDQAAQIQEVSAHVDMSKRESQTVAINQ